MNLALPFSCHFLDGKGRNQTERDGSGRKFEISEDAANIGKTACCRVVGVQRVKRFKSLFPLHLPRQVLNLPGFFFCLQQRDPILFPIRSNAARSLGFFLAVWRVPSWRHSRRCLGRVDSSLSHMEFLRRHDHVRQN